MGPMVLGSFADLCVDDVGTCASFYVRLLELEVIVDQGWYCELGVDGRTLLALVEERHETVPDAADGLARGLLVSFEVDDAQQVAIAAAELGCSFIVPQFATSASSTSWSPIRTGRSSTSSSACR